MLPNKHSTSRPGWVTVSPNFTETEKDKIRGQRCFKQKNQDKKTWKKIMKSNVPDTEFKA